MNKSAVTPSILLQAERARVRRRDKKGQPSAPAEPQLRTQLLQPHAIGLGRGPAGAGGPRGHRDKARHTGDHGWEHVRVGRAQNLRTCGCS